MATLEQKYANRCLSVAHASNNAFLVSISLFAPLLICIRADLFAQSSFPHALARRVKFAMVDCIRHFLLVFAFRVCCGSAQLPRPFAQFQVWDYARLMGAHDLRMLGSEVPTLIVVRKWAEECKVVVGGIVGRMCAWMVGFAQDPAVHAGEGERS